MPIHDHFRPPVETLLPWPSMHGGWIGEIAGSLNERMPPGYVALDRFRIDGGLEVDIATLEGNDITPIPNDLGTGGSAIATTQAVYTPPAPTGTSSFQFADVAEVRVFAENSTRTLIGAIELVSPRNKDRLDSREAFIGKCLGYLANGVSVVVVDVVTGRRANLHNEIARRLNAPVEIELPAEAQLYASAYRPASVGKKARVDFWVTPFGIGDELPTMPLRLVGNYFVPVELEATYTETCRRRRFTP